MSIGYACLTIGVLEANFKSCTIKNASRENLLKIIEHNLNSLNTIIDYNNKNNIRLFRISSELIPFGSHPINDIYWWEIYSKEFEFIGSKIKNFNMRVSMHPGQYTVLNSQDENVVLKAIEDLNYHNRVLDSLGVGKEGKIILHIGGVYKDKEKSIQRFIQNYNLLSHDVKERLVVENDDKSYNIGDVLRIGKTLNIPVVFDNLHNKVLPYDVSKDEQHWIKECKKTWNIGDGAQKIHYSQQDKSKKSGAHSKTIKLVEFMKFIDKIDDEIDIMLEVKDKNLSAIKCINSLYNTRTIKNLELEWSKYKYSVLEHSNLHYNKIRQLLKNKVDYPVIEFYRLIDEALDLEEDIGSVVNAALHVWGYFKSISQEYEKDKWSKLVCGYKNGNKSKEILKKFLWKMTLKYKEPYLLKSYYFHII